MSIYNNKLSKESKKFYERELRQFWKNKEKLNNILEKQKKCLYEDYISSRTILYLEERINNIENTIKQLNTFELQIFELIFKEHYDWIYCYSQKNISKSTYYNIFNKVIYILAKEFGEI